MRKFWHMRAVAIVILFMWEGIVIAAENRPPTPEEFKKMIQQYNESGKAPGLQRPPQPPRGAEQFNRALALHTKKGATPAELKEAAQLYQSALDDGIPQAGTNLALLYLEGKGVKKDVRKATTLLQAASRNNDTQADVALARLYLNGSDVPRDEKKGEALLSKAAKAGNPNAVTMLAEYKEWKKKNEKSMKEYQELLKQIQSSQAKPGGAAMPPLQVIPQPKTAPLFPVIPGYSYLAGWTAPPFFLNMPPPRSQPFTVIPEGKSSLPARTETAVQPDQEKPGVQPSPGSTVTGTGENTTGK
jgi:hypothetical protein